MHSDHDFTNRHEELKLEFADFPPIRIDLPVQDFKVRAFF